MADIQALAKIALDLKNLKRKGWEKRGIRNPESVAEHCFSVSVIALGLCEGLHKLRIDIEKVLAMAIVHDMAEAIVSDITPHDHNFRQKEMLEARAMDKIAQETGLEFLPRLLGEYTAGRTDEAKIVHDADRLEMVFQAAEYQKRHPDKDLSEFFSYVEGKLFYGESRKIFEQLRKQPI